MWSRSLSKNCIQYSEIRFVGKKELPRKKCLQYSIMKLKTRLISNLDGVPSFVLV